MDRKRGAEEDQRHHMLLANYRREVLESQVEVQKQAFERVGIALYDNIGQMLSTAKIYLYSLEESELNQEQRVYVNQTNEIVGQSITDLRGLIRQLEGCMAHEFKLQDCIGQQLQRIRKKYQVATELLIKGAVYSLGYEKEIVLFRILQDLTNAIFRGAQRSDVMIVFNYASAQLMVEVKSSGQGLAEWQQEAQMAWTDTNHRAQIIGGKCTFESIAEAGTSVKIELKNPSFNSSTGGHKAL